KDMILSGGQNVYPQDIEAILIEHELIHDVAVIGVQSQRWGETPIAIVVTGRAPADKNEIINWCNSRVGKQQRIADVLFAEELPRNPNGKVLKRELKKRFAGLNYP
ncbi:MAG: class I adenylate-forming enzyme family protein, partial [Pseudomonadales bacterium]